MRMKRKVPRTRVWGNALIAVAGRNPPTKPFTSDELAKLMKIEGYGASNILKRLRTHGYVRVVGFTRARGNGVGRQRNLYVITPSGQKSAEYWRRRRP